MYYSRVLSDKLTAYSDSQEILRILCNHKVHYRAKETMLESHNAIRHDL
jgi:hypothetical protein